MGGLTRERRAGVLGAAGAIIRRDFTVYLSYRGRLVGQLLQVLFSLALFYYISRLLGVTRFGSPDSYYAFAVVGLVIIQMLTAPLMTLPTGVRQELVAGTFERLVLSPCGAVVGIVAMTVFPIAAALVIGAITLGFAALVFDLPVVSATAPLAVPISLLGALAFAPFALLLSAAVLTFRQVTAATGALVTLMSLIGGFFFPVDLLPAWIQWASEVQPFTPTVELLRNVLVGTPMTEPVGIAVGKLVMFSLVLFPLGILATSAALHRSQRRGTVIEY